MTFAIETNFPGGNACAIEVEERGSITRIAFAPDPHGGPEILWFNFRVLRTTPKAPSTLELELKHSYNMLDGGAPQNFRPAIRYAERDWERLPAPAIEETPDGRARVLWTLAAPATSVEVAVCFPYGQSEVETLLEKTGGYWKRDTIGVGQRSTPLQRLANDYSHLENERPGLYLLARQHSGETPGSWVLDGCLRRMQEKHEQAPLVWAVPLADADGVHYGDYGKDQPPYDLNRAWENPPMRHETLVIRRDINRWSHRCRPTLALDFHAPGACENDGVYGFLPAHEKSTEHYPLLHEFLGMMQETLTPQFASPNLERVAKYPSRWDTWNFAQFMANEYDVPAVSMEIPYSLCGERPLMRADYQEIGARIADTIISFLAKK